MERGFNPEERGQQNARRDKTDGLTKVIRQDRVSNRDMARNSFIESSVSKLPKCRSQMLLSVESFFFKRLELWVASDLELFARLCLA